MAAEDEGRTEEASESKLERARREEGRVPKSKEISDNLILLFVILMVFVLGKWILAQCTEIFRFYFSRCTQENVLDRNLGTAFLINYAKLILPTCLVAILVGIAANVFQNKGFIFTTKPLTPKFENLIPKFGEYFKRTLWSAKGLFNLGKSFFKIFMICIVGYYQIKKDIPILIQIINNGQILAALGMIGTMAFQLLIICAVLFLVLAIPDYILERRRFLDEMKMTKYEQKQEYKEQEGDPVMKSRLIQAQRQMLRQNIRQAVKEADVVIANPTHVAVALKYEAKNRDSRPVLTAKGVDNTALFMRKLAQENNVEVITNRPVARELYTNVEIGATIPEEYIMAVATIYRQLDKYSKYSKK